MATQSPFSFLAEAASQLGAQLSQRLAPPPWLVSELQQRAVLFINHVLMQEPDAQARLLRQSGRVVRVQWRTLALQLRATPAGLAELAPEAQPDLLLTVTDTSPLDLAKGALAGDKPGVRIEGDVQLAADVSWLVDNLRWDVEEDLSRLLGDAPAHALAQAGRKLAAGLRQFVAGLPGRRAP